MHCNYSCMRPNVDIQIMLLNMYLHSVRCIYIGISQFMLGERPFLLREKFQSDHMQVVDSIQDFLKLAGELLFELPLYLFVSTRKWRQAVDAQNLAIEEITKVGKLYVYLSVSLYMLQYITAQTYWRIAQNYTYLHVESCINCVTHFCSVTVACRGPYGRCNAQRCRGRDCTEEPHLSHAQHQWDEPDQHCAQHCLSACCWN